MVWQEEGHDFIDIELEDPAARLDIVREEGYPTHLNLLTIHSITFPVGASMRYGPRSAKNLPIALSNTAISSCGNSVLSTVLAWSENSDSSKASSFGSTLHN